MEKSIRETIYHLDVFTAFSNANVDQLAKLVLENASKRYSDDPTTAPYEDSFCPASPILNEIVDEIKELYNLNTEGDNQLELDRYWGLVHEPNMSTNQHSHIPIDVAAVVYLSVPPGCGKLVFYPTNYPLGERYWFEPKKGMIILFPGWLEHAVTRNLSEEPRISLSLNFNVKKDDQRT